MSSDALTVSIATRGHHHWAINQNDIAVLTPSCGLSVDRERVRRNPDLTLGKGLQDGPRLLIVICSNSWTAGVLPHFPNGEYKPYEVFKPIL